MSVYPRKNKNGTRTWWFTKTINGKRERKRIPTARTKAQAQEAERDFLKQIHEGTFGSQKAVITFKQFVEETFKPWTKSNKKSWRSDLSRLKPLVEFFGKYGLNEITPFLVESYKVRRFKTPVVYKSKENSMAKEKPRSQATVNREIQLLSRVFSLAISERKIEENPCDARNFPKGKKLLKGERRRKRRLSPDERVKLLAALNTDSRRHILRMVILDLNTGLRKGEIFNLRVEDVDFARNVIKLTETKTDEYREVEMNSIVQDLLAELVTEATANGHKYLFTSPRTGSRYQCIKKSFRSALKDAEIEDFRFHDLRHTFSSLAGDDPNVSINALAETLGHKNWRTTMQYTHSAKEARLRVVQAVENRQSDEPGHITVIQAKRQAG
jgi:integrase